MQEITFFITYVSNALLLFSALRISNYSYIVNGEFAVSAPGTYEAAGARFLYTRTAGLDNVYAYGPLRSSIDIMVCFSILLEWN